ncbi:uncharacterized protein BDR25DRAFT_98486 [Lindgomyces ingoldianus]|uniref:Uncharacterized protein n=1 Tax=Lindgomyces ingoldianus TaxID=673940 RepID=A0ACB6QCY7_9PLEO|nr:uncharacterized protein BDR25DRAFT_98486 [Lindgomyces ingoldianus]KAF2464365.1 hypothetical protein BDR25DRAFT_98486 [Lindgomyces ingoldianus]
MQRIRPTDRFIRIKNWKGGTLLLYMFDPLIAKIIDWLGLVGRTGMGIGFCFGEGKEHGLRLTHQVYGIDLGHHFSPRNPVNSLPMVHHVEFGPNTHTHTQKQEWILALPNMPSLQLQALKFRRDSLWRLLVGWFGSSTFILDGSYVRP